MLEQLVEMVAVFARQQLSQLTMKASVGLCDRLGADTLDDIERRGDTPLAQITEHYSPQGVIAANGVACTATPTLISLSFFRL